MRILAVILVLAAGFALLNFDLPSIRPEAAGSCSDCHATVVELPVIHPPAEKNCAICHESTGKSHPGDDKGFGLKEELRDLCYGCHEEVREQADASAFTHQVMQRDGSCTLCHSPHSSNEKKLLVGNTKTVCLSCHNKSVTADNKPTVNMKELLAESKYIHPAVDRGGCSPCHTAHGSSYPNILNNAYPEGMYLKATADSFALCWDCHDIDMVESPVTATATGFRNGQENLHYVHIRGDRGRNCTTCHDVHAAGNPHLVRDQLSFGSWAMPMNFIIQDEGGSCAPGCHGVKEYKR